MIYFYADSRDGVAGAGSLCGCCDTVNLRPGEANAIRLNYAAWALPLEAELEPTLEFYLEPDTTGCSTASISGFQPPYNTNYTLATPAGTLLSMDFSVNEQPVGNAFTYRILPLSGPAHGTVAQTGTSGDPTFDYSPQAGFQGYDYFSYEMTDAQGRSVIRHVRVSVGVHNAIPTPEKMALEPFVASTAISLNGEMFEVIIPIYMPTNIRACEKFKLTIRQSATACEGAVYQHLSCFDIRPIGC